ncbi:hypothetical protein F5B18DRAFT_169923 [Nemania serpens]|nr:hypothetical protein F5B18DRAFT_169923 [Nemania serpens]
MAPPTYIISRVADPIFALAIGLGAAALRINREEKEKGKTTQQTINSAKRIICQIWPLIPLRYFHNPTISYPNRLIESPLQQIGSALGTWPLALGSYSSGYDRQYWCDCDGHAYRNGMPGGELML